MDGHIILCGYGHVGYRVARLLRRLGSGVVVLYDQAPAERVREAQDDGCLCLQGDASSTTLLEQADIAQARALVAATDDDLVNLSIALDARRLNPALVVVARMFDQHLAPYVRRLIEVRGPFSTTALATPVFVAAALGDDVVECFTFADRPLVVAEERPTARGNAAGDAAVPLLRARGGAVHVASPADPADSRWDATLVLRRPGRARASTRRGPPRVPWSPRRWLARVPAGLRTVMLVLLAVVTVSVFVFQAGMGLSLLDALYFVTTTITTVGYGDVNLLHASPALKLYGVLLMLCGAALLATLFGIVTDFVVSARLRELVAAGGQPAGSHVVVAGDGHIGQRVVAALRQAGEEVVVIAADRHAAVRERGVFLVNGDPRQRDTLLRAGVADARAIIALDDDDITNLGAALLARELNPGLRAVARVFDPALGRKLQEGLGIDRVLSISAVAAPMLAASCLFPDVVEAFVWREHLVVGRQPGSGETRPESPEGGPAVAAGHFGRFRAVGGSGVLEPVTDGSGGDGTLEFLVLPLRAPGSSCPA